MNREQVRQSKIEWDPVTGEINDSLTGDYLWSCVNVGEAVSVVMTPFTYSFGHTCFSEFDFIPGISFTGNIGGRVYANRSLELMVQRRFGKLGANVKISTKELAGGIDASVDPAEKFLLLSNRVFFENVIPNAISVLVKHAWKARNVSGLISGNRAWCRTMAGRVENAKTMAEMVPLWVQVIHPYMLLAFHRVIATAFRFGLLTGKLRPKLIEMVGAVDTDVLLTNADRSELLESLGPVVGLSRVAKGSMSRDIYRDCWGHRGVLELEAAAPRPFEDPCWPDHELKAFQMSKVDVDALLKNKRLEYENARARLCMRYPRQQKSIMRRLEQCTAANQRRELVRSEFIRLVGVIRAWARKSGALAGIGDNVFFLTVEEILELLSGVDKSSYYIPARRKTYELYKALPPYPSLICGRFDPVQWGIDSTQSDVCHNYGEKSSQGGANQTGSTIFRGVPGSAGEVFGRVRVLRSPEESDKLVDGEILVTSSTNIGWTMLFPRVKAIVTDIGASLSHAAIVARELGIPAVVNCGDATRRLRTGDKIFVDGSNGIVEIIDDSTENKERETSI